MYMNSYVHCERFCTSAAVHNAPARDHSDAMRPWLGYNSKYMNARAEDSAGIRPWMPLPSSHR